MNSLKKELLKYIPKDSIEFNSEVLNKFSQDRAIIEPYGNPIALVMPKSKEEIFPIIKIANKFKVPIVTRGAGTGLTGASNAINGCILLSLHRLNKILSLDISNRMIFVEPGVINSTIKKAVEKKKFILSS